MSFEANKLVAGLWIKAREYPAFGIPPVEVEDVYLAQAVSTNLAASSQPGRDVKQAISDAVNTHSLNTPLRSGISKFFPWFTQQGGTHYIRFKDGTFEKTGRLVPEEFYPVYVCNQDTDYDVGDIAELFAAAATDGVSPAEVTDPAGRRYRALTIDALTYLPVVVNRFTDTVTEGFDRVLGDDTEHVRLSYSLGEDSMRSAYYSKIKVCDISTSSSKQAKGRLSHKVSLEGPPAREAREEQEQKVE